MVKEWVLYKDNNFGDNKGRQFLLSNVQILHGFRITIRSLQTDSSLLQNLTLHSERYYHLTQ